MRYIKLKATKYLKMCYWLDTMHWWGGLGWGPHHSGCRALSRGRRITGQEQCLAGPPSPGHVALPVAACASPGSCPPVSCCACAGEGCGCKRSACCLLRIVRRETLPSSEKGSRHVRWCSDFRKNSVTLGVHSAFAQKQALRPGLGWSSCLSASPESVPPPIPSRLIVGFAPSSLITIITQDTRQFNYTSQYSDVIISYSCHLDPKITTVCFLWMLTYNQQLP